MDKKNSEKRFFGIFSTMMFVAVTALMLASCGTSTDTNATTGRLLSGEIDSVASTSVSKTSTTKADQGASCIGDICSVMATDSNGLTVEGTVHPEDTGWMWEIRLTAGSWKIGFYDLNNELLGYLEVNGITEFTLDEGEDIHFGKVQLIDGKIIAEDIEGLGERGFRSSDDFDEDFDPNIFSIVKARPEDGSTDVAPCRPIKIRLSQSIDQATMNENTILVTNELNEVVSGTLSYEEEIEDEGEDEGEAEIESEYKIKFVPTNNFSLGSIISVSAPSKAEGLLNTLGEPLDKDYIWSFTVRDFGEANATCHDPDDEYGKYRERERERNGDGEAGNGQNEVENEQEGPEGD